MINPFRNVFFTSRMYFSLAGAVFLFLVGFILPFVFFLAKWIIIFFLLTVALDLALLFAHRTGIRAKRNMVHRFSMGDPNKVSIVIDNYYSFEITVLAIDEIPEQFQIRTLQHILTISGGMTSSCSYDLIPFERGEFLFGKINVFVRNSRLGFAERLISIPCQTEVAVFPSFQQMKKYELIAFSNQITDSGIRRYRKIGHSFEFEQVKEYVKGDDFRTINWKATARMQHLMVNQFQEEKAQQVYCILDMGRSMKMPFNSMSLLDHSINSSLAISNIILKKNDKSGVAAFTNSTVSFLSADRKSDQLSRIIEMLYRQKTNFLESNFENLYLNIRNKIKQRSLIFLFTNFESKVSANRQIPFFRKIASQHLLIVIFFENSELKETVKKPVNELKGIYKKAIAENFILSKRLIVKELEINGISSILTTPENLTINTVNKYIELKSRGII